MKIKKFNESKINEGYNEQDKVLSSYITTVRGSECDYDYLVLKTESGREFRVDASETDDDEYYESVGKLDESRYKTSKELGKIDTTCKEIFDYLECQGFKLNDKDKSFVKRKINKI